VRGLVLNEKQDSRRALGHRAILANEPEGAKIGMEEAMLVLGQGEKGGQRK
jgi:hypothetical protein